MFLSIIKTRCQLKLSEIEWGVTIFIIGYHLALLIGLPFYFIHHSPPVGLYVVSAVLLYLTGLGVTVGYHRLYAHPTYKTNKFVEAIILFFASMATQGSALKWAHDHRNHHAYVDTDKDPYSIKKGFWYAHILWLFRKLPPIDEKIVADLCRNKLVMFQHKFYVPLMVLTNTLTTLLIGYLFDNYLGAFVLTWGVRLFFLHHFTWFINSLAHTWGSQSFSQEHSAVDNYCISLLTFGEGYHNYHHTYANDYRNGIKWYHFDPTKWIIWTLSKCKLATGLRRVNTYQIKERMVIESKNEIKQSWLGRKKALFEKIEKFSQSLLDEISTVRRLTTEYKLSKKRRESKEQIRSLSLKIKMLRKSLKNDLKSWRRLSKKILRFDLNPKFSNFSLRNEMTDEVELPFKEMAVLEEF